MGWIEAGCEAVFASVDNAFIQREKTRDVTRGVQRREGQDENVVLPLSDGVGRGSCSSGGERI